MCNSRNGPTSPQQLQLVVQQLQQQLLLVLAAIVAVMGLAVARPGCSRGWQLRALRGYRSQQQ